MDGKQQCKDVLSSDIIKTISEAVEGLSQGSVTITVHKSRIVQVEVSHGRKFDDSWLIQDGGGI